MTLRSIPAAAVCAVVAAGLSGCELQEVTVVDVEAVVVAEVYADLAPDRADNAVRAFLHWTVGVQASSLADLSASTIVVRRGDGLTLPLSPAPPEACIRSAPDGDVGACFLSGQEADQLRPLDLLEVTVTLPGGGVIEGAASVPGDFDVLGIASSCRLAPDRLLPVEWSRAESAWAYINEASIRGLPDALRGEGIIVEDDPLYLLGLSISDDDTGIVFPSEFGVFNRFDLDQSLAVRLQRGLPETSSAEVSITAVDRNYVNWARGGNFNPSGQVRVPSLSGDGTGVFGATLGRRFDVFATSDPQSGLPVCGT